MTDEEVREWVRGRLAFESWLRALHAARDASEPAEDLAPRPVKGEGASAHPESEGAPRPLPRRRSGLAA